LLGQLSDVAVGIDRGQTPINVRETSHMLDLVM
jgi:hypothetical protein